MEGSGVLGAKQEGEPEAAAGSAEVRSAGAAEAAACSSGRCSEQEHARLSGGWWQWGGEKGRVASRKKAQL